MAIEFSQLIEPTELTTSLAILLVSIFFLLAYFGYRLRHAVIIVMWTLTLTVFVLTIVVNLSFVWFWIMVLVSALVIAFVGTMRYLIAA